jgi:ribosomal protein S18 acetylase RimI-like enzyme
MLFVKRDETRTILSFLHVLEPYRGAGVGEALLHYALEFIAQDTRELMTEFIPFHPVALDPVFECYGFTKIERQIMRRPTGAIAPAYASGFVFTPPSVSDLEALGTVLADAYIGHPEWFLFPEVQSRSKALAYLTRAVNGHFGPFVPDFAIAAWKDGQCAGFGVGCQVLPGLGFVLHLAVRPSFQGNGMGRCLLEALSAAFARHGLNYIALGVTCDNPAVKMYKCAGFREKTRIPVYYRLAGAFEGVSS